MDPKLEQFKHLLEYFVAHIEYVTNHDTNFLGYNQYIKPHIDAGDFQEKGFGHKAGSSFSKKTIAAWNDFGNGNVVNITVDSRFQGAINRGVFLHWWNGYSVKANWKLDADTREHHVISLIICFKNDSAEKEASLEALGLFDGKEPNDELRKFWAYYESRDDSHTDDKVNEDSGNGALLSEVGDYLLWHNKNLILTGAPGTGKTYLAKQVAEWYACNEDDEPEDFRMAQVQFHPSYDYTDFVEGLRPVSQTNGQIGFKRQDGIFKTFCKTALAHPDKLFVFIIDEINRGDINKIFGELFYAIDPSYRGTKGRVRTQYQNLVPADDAFADGFYVPENVYIIGTMNDIDRSVESMDFAFRRRFAWREVDPCETLEMLKEDNLELAHVIEPDPTKQEELSDKEQQKLVDKLKAASFYEVVTAYCNNLNRAISNEVSLGAKYQIGPSYYLKTLNFLDLWSDIGEEQLQEALEQVWRLHLEPVLREYLRGRSHKDSDNIIAALKESYSQSVAADGEE